MKGLCINFPKLNALKWEAVWAKYRYEAIIIHMNYNFKKMFQIMGTSTV